MPCAPTAFVAKTPPFLADLRVVAVTSKGRGGVLGPGYNVKYLSDKCDEKGHARSVLTKAIGGSQDAARYKTPPFNCNSLPFTAFQLQFTAFHRLSS